MAISTQIEILNNGIESWNKWVAENLEVRICFTRADLGHRDLQTGNFGNAYFQAANFEQSVFDYARLKHADFSAANLVGASFADVDASESVFCGADVSGTVFRNADLRGCNFQGTDLTDVEFYGSNLEGTDFSGARLSNTKFYGCDVSECVFDSAYANRVIFHETNLCSTSFKDVEMGWAIIAGCDLSLCRHLETISHFAQSSIGIETLVNSNVDFPELLLNNFGVPKEWIASLLHEETPEMQTADSQDNENESVSSQASAQSLHDNPMATNGMQFVDLVESLSGLDQKNETDDPLIEERSSQQENMVVSSIPQINDAEEAVIGVKANGENDSDSDVNTETESHGTSWSQRSSPMNQSS